MPTEEQKMWLVNQVRRESKLNDDLIGVEIFVIAFLYSLQITFTNEPLRQQQHSCLAEEIQGESQNDFPPNLFWCCVRKVQPN
jgi:hypothetical protein